MNTTSNNFIRHSLQRHVKVGILLVFFVTIAQLGLATSYITLNDGRLHVFPDSCVSSMITDDSQVTITAVNGRIFTYLLTDIQSIDHQLTKELPTITSYKYNSKDNYQLISNETGVINDDQINTSVVGIGKWLTPTFILSDENANVYVDGVEHKSAQSRISFARDRVYTVGYAGDRILSMADDGTCSMQPYGRQYTVHVDFLTDSTTSVPRIDINTVGGVNISSKKYYLDAEIIIDGAGIFPSMTDSVKVKGRGNTTWSSNPNDKNPYRLKFAKKVKPLGLPKGKNWVLLANKRTGSMLTNAFGMKAASLLGTVASNHIIPVDLYVNGTYKGSYNLTEKVGFSSNSVDLDDETAATLLEFDVHYDEEEGQKFWTTTYSVPVNVKKPDFNDSTTTTVLTLSMIKNRVNKYVKAVIKRDNMLDHIDVESAATYLMLNDFILNYEIMHPKSAFCYNEDITDDSSKFIFGPVWDLDWAFGYSTAHTYFTAPTDVNFYTNISMSHYRLYYYMRLEPEIARRCYELWNNFMENGLDELVDFCQEYYDYVKPSLDKDKADPTKYDVQAVRAANWLRKRANDLCKAFRAEFAVPGDVNADGEVNIADVNCLIDIILGIRTADEFEGRALVNDDEEVNIADVNCVIDIILGH